MATASQLGVAFFGPNTDDGHRHGWPSTLKEAVETMENATRRLVGASGQDGRDDPFAFDGSMNLIQKIIQGTQGWEGRKGTWYPELTAEVIGRPIFTMGGSRAGLPFHEHEAAWIWLVHGMKHWFLLPPGRVPDGLPKSGEGQSVWSWLTAEDGELRMPSAAGNLSGMLQCTQRPGEVMFVPGKWFHATFNVGIALGFGAQGSYAKQTRSLAEIEADLAASPDAAALYVEKAGVLSDSKAKLEVLKQGGAADPMHYGVWMATLGLVAEAGSLKALKAQLASIWKRLKRAEESGSLSQEQVSIVLGHLLAVVLEKPKRQQDRQCIELCVQYLELAVERSGHNDYALFYLGAALFMSGQHKQAEKRLAQCLEVKPQHERARMMLDMLRKQSGR